jgi:hypothetical protein
VSVPEKILAGPPLKMAVRGPSFIWATARHPLPPPSSPRKIVIDYSVRSGFTVAHILLPVSGNNSLSVSLLKEQYHNNTK